MERTAFPTVVAMESATTPSLPSINVKTGLLIRIELLLWWWFTRLVKLANKKSTQISHVYCLGPVWFSTTRLALTSRVPNLRGRRHRWDCFQEGDDEIDNDKNDDFLSYIFSVSENTKIIHLIMMIWLLSFIVSSYKLALGPPKDPGGSKKILSKSRIWFIEFSP